MNGTVEDHVTHLVNAAESVLNKIEQWRDHPTSDKTVIKECQTAETTLKKAIELVKRQAR